LLCGIDVGAEEDVTRLQNEEAKNSLMRRAYSENTREGDKRS
jgi:hypothetical protein